MRAVVRLSSRQLAPAGRARLSPPVHTLRRPYSTAPESSPQPPKHDGPTAEAEQKKGRGFLFIPTPSMSTPVGDAAITTLVGIGILFLGGVAYVAWYKKRVLDKMEIAFAPGYDPALDLATHPVKNPSVQEPLLQDLDAENDGPWTQHLRRKEQDYLDAIVHGAETGHYFILLGPKGVGKTTMILDAMRRNAADGVAMCDAHPDLEVFRLRLGKALNYEYNEDSQTGVFQRRDPREGGPALDIERALTKLEKVALRVSRRTGRPLVLIINNVHFFKNDDDGRNMLLQLQQRAESWCASGTLTMVFSTDDFWPFFFLRKNASRMHVMSVSDLTTHEATLASLRMWHDKHRKYPTDDERSGLEDAIGVVGGRLSYLSKVAKARETSTYAQHLLAVEKGWLLSQIGLIPDLDDDVMDEQKWSSCSWLLLREFVKQHAENVKAHEAARARGEHVPAELDLPKIPYYKCRQIMTRPDFLEDLDRLNIIHIDINHDVRPDSMLILHCARQVVEEEGFDELLDNVRDRVDEIESLHRTRELTFKDVDKGDRIRLVVDKGGAILVDE